MLTDAAIVSFLGKFRLDSYGKRKDFIYEKVNSIVFGSLTLWLGGCDSNIYVNSLVKGELVDSENDEQIANQIPQWIMNTE